MVNMATSGQTSWISLRYHLILLLLLTLSLFVQERVWRAGDEDKNDPSNPYRDRDGGYPHYCRCHRAQDRHRNKSVVCTTLFTVPFSRLYLETIDVTQHVTTTQILPTTRVWVSTETLDQTKVVEHTLTATETATKIWTYETTQTDTKTETATETQTYLNTVTQGMLRLSRDPCFTSNSFRTHSLHQGRADHLR
jgi:hypothetical protein